MQTEAHCELGNKSVPITFQVVPLFSLLYNPPEAVVVYIMDESEGWNLICVQRPIPFICPLTLVGKTIGPLHVQLPAICALMLLLKKKNNKINMESNFLMVLPPSIIVIVVVEIISNHLFVQKEASSFSNARSVYNRGENAHIFDPYHDEATVLTKNPFLFLH